MTDPGIALLLKNEISGQVLLDETMANHTSFRIGGPADVMVTPATTEDVRTVLCIARENDVPLTVLGNGSNVLVRDKGIRGIVLKMGNALKCRQKKDNEFTFCHKAWF